jgi:hypothetical protein
VSAGSFAHDAQEFLSSVSSHRSDRQRRKALGERFKYDVISSNLLSTALSGPPSSHSTSFRNVPFPGDLDASPSPGRRPLSPTPESVPGAMATAPAEGMLVSNPQSVQFAAGLLVAALVAAVFLSWLLAVVLAANAIYTYIDREPANVQPEVDGLASVSGSSCSIVEILMTGCRRWRTSASCVRRATTGTRRCRRL